MNYVSKVMRLQLVNRWTFIGVPLMVLGGSLLIVILLGLVVPNDGVMITGAAQAPLWYFIVVGVQALSLTFPFSQAMSVTRRDYFLGTLATFVLFSLAFGVVFLVLALIEQATSGWGVDTLIFAIPWLLNAGWLAMILSVAALALVMFLIGLWMATIYKRWGTVVIVAISLGLGLVLVGVIALITYFQWWQAVLTWVVGQTPMSMAGWLLVLIVALSAGSFLTLRKVTT